MPPGYAYDAHGKLQLNPQFTQVHPKGPFDFGAMAHNIHWPGVLTDMATILGGAVAPLEQLPIEAAAVTPVRKLVGSLLGTGGGLWKKQDDVNKKPNQTPMSNDRASDG